MISGFEILVPEIGPDCNYSITGADCQILALNVKPGQSVECEPGSMMMMSDKMKTKARCGNCSRVCVGESLCKVIYTNSDDKDAFLALTPNFPSKVIPIELNKVGGKFVARSGAYMGSQGDVSLKVDCDCNCCTCCCGGMGMARQLAQGTGTLFINGSGTVVQKVLAPKEKVIVDTTSVVGFEEKVELGIERAGGCCSCCCGGEGMFNTTLTGPGLVVLQSMSFERYRQALQPPVPLDTASGGGGQHGLSA